MIKADQSIKADAACIEKVILEEVISTTTLHMKSDEICKEIYIFKIKLKEKKVPLLFIKSLEQVITFHTYFVLHYKEEVKELCIYRQMREDKIQFGKVYETQWQEQVLKELPYCSSLKDVYRHLLLQLIPLTPRVEEDLATFITRATQIEKLEKQKITLHKKAEREKQPRKKFDLGRDIRSLQIQLDQLKGNK